jgi:hypothetical protein
VALDAIGDLWQAEFFDTVTGKDIVTSRLVVRNRRITVVLPDFQGAIAVRLNRL